MTNMQSILAHFGATQLQDLFQGTSHHSQSHTLVPHKFNIVTMCVCLISKCAQNEIARLTT